MLRLLDDYDISKLSDDNRLILEGYNTCLDCIQTSIDEVLNKRNPDSIKNKIIQEIKQETIDSIVNILNDKTKELVETKGGK